MQLLPGEGADTKIAKGRDDILPRDKNPEKYGKKMKGGGEAVSLNQIFTTLCSAAPFVGSEMVRLTDSERKGYLYKGAHFIKSPGVLK